MLSYSAVTLFSFLFPWPVSSSEQPCTSRCYNSLQLTKESLDKFTSHLTGGSTDPQSVMLPADLIIGRSSLNLWIRYVIGSAVVIGSVDRCALSAIHGVWSNSQLYHFPDMLKELVKKNDRDTVARFIARITGEYFWLTELGRSVAKLAKNEWNVMRPLFEEVLTIMKESKNKDKEYGDMMEHMPIEFQYERISSGQVPFGEIDKVYLSGEPPHSPLRDIFFRARWSHTPNPQIREYIAERAPWFRQFMPEDISSKFKDTAVTSIVEPGHDVWTRIRNFMDVETLIFVWPLVCSIWNKSYSKVLTEDARIQEWFLQDLGHVYWGQIHTTAPWNRFLNKTSSALYMGRCIINGALGRVELNDRLYRSVKEYLCCAIRGMASIPKASEGSALYSSFVKLIEEGYKANSHWMPPLAKPSFLTDEEHENAIHHLVCQKKLAVRLSDRWIIDNVSRIYSLLGEDQLLVKAVVDLSANDLQEVLFIWIMIGQASGMTEDTARLVFGRPGKFAEKLIEPVIVKPSNYYDFIVDSGMLFEIINIYREEIERDRTTPISRRKYEFGHFVVSLVLFFKSRPDKIEQIVASMTSQLLTFSKRVLKSIKRRFEIEALDILMNNSKHLPEDMKFVKEVLTRCGLLDESEV